MKTIGMLGGMSWESTQTYYRLANQRVRDRLGGLHSAKIVLYSVDFAQIEALQHAGEWARMAEILGSAAQAVEAAGAELLVICTNTMHKVAPEIAAAVGIPLVHIADATAEVLSRDGVAKVGLLGTRFTMEQPFYKERLQAHGLQVVTPDEPGREDVHRIIYSELCRGDINPDSRERFLAIIETLRQQGAEAVILGCTEIGLLVSQADTSVRLYDTTEIHVERAVEKALGRVD